MDERQLAALNPPRRDGLARLFGPDDAFEAAAYRQRRSVQPEMGRSLGTAQDTINSYLVPQSPLDVAAMLFGGLPGRAAKAGALALGGALQSSDAEAGPLSKLVKGLRLPIRASTDDANQALDASFKYGTLGGNKTVPIDSLTGGLATMQEGRVAALAEKMRGPEGHISRLLVDDAGNVIEGQHRLAALKRIGQTDVPVTVLRDLSRGYDVDAMEKAARALGGLHGDQVKGVVQRALESAHEAGGASKALGAYDLPGFQKYFDAALGAAKKTLPAGTGVAALMGLGATDQAEAGPLGKLQRAAVKIGDRVFAGPNHAMAYEEAAKGTGRSFDDLVNTYGGLHEDAKTTGFLTSDGRFVNRKEATKIAAQSDTMKPGYGSNPSGPLLSEDLRPGSIWSLPGMAAAGAGGGMLAGGGEAEAGPLAALLRKYGLAGMAIPPGLAATQGEQRQ
jgi:hypothetical protein